MSYTKTETKIEIRRAKRTAIFNLFDSASDMATRVIACGAQSPFGSGAPIAGIVNRGDLSEAAQSDKFLAKFESLSFVSTGFETIDMVVGAVPNVGAYVAGNPLNMRVRRRTEKEQAPLAIVVDLTTSAGIDHKCMAVRGSAILALTRVLSAVRPVELWAFTGLSLGRGDTGGVYAGVRLETSPLDLSRAAPVLANPDFARKAMYGLCNHRDHGGAGGGWPFGASLTAAELESVMRVALPHLTDVLSVPPAHMNDDSIARPEKWLLDRIKTYAPQGA